jgi:hypothetical protein
MLRSLRRKRYADKVEVQLRLEVESVRNDPRQALRLRKQIVFDRHGFALRTHHATPCAAPIWLIRANDEPKGDPAHEHRFSDWSKLTTTGLHEFWTPGTHVSIKDHPYVRALAACIDAQIEATIS